MGLVRLQNIMSNELAKRTIFSRPPEPPHEYLLNNPADSIFIGITKLFSVPFTWTFANLTNPHIAVVGITGAGKSFFVKTFLTRASYIWNTNAVIVDFAGEYKAWVKQSGGIIVSLGKGDFINILDLSGMKPLDRSKQIMTSFEILTEINDYPEQKRLTVEAIEQAYVNFGFAMAEAPPPEKEAPTLKDVINLLEEKLQEGTYEYPAELENAVYRLRQFAREGEDFFARKSTIDLGKLASSGLVDIDLSGLPDEKFRAMAALFVLQTLKEKMRMEGWSASKGLKTLVVLDEAWKVASDDRSDAVMIVREGRKYQFGLIVASQNPTDINEAIFSNVGTSFMLRIKFEKFLNYLQGSLNFSDFMRKEIGKFGVGQAAIDMSFQTSVQFPEVFLIDRIIGEVPLDVYTITIAEVLGPKELDDANVLKEYYLERIDLNAKFIQANINSDVINATFKELDTRNRMIDIRSLVQTLVNEKVSKDAIVELLRSMGLSDAIITKIFIYIT
jgi:DNA helicase HerA-like ATPase